MLQKIKKLLLLSKQEKFILLSLFVWLCIGRILRLRIVSWLGNERQTRQPIPLTLSQQKIVHYNKIVISKIIARIPWECACLLQAFAVTQVLKSYDIPYQVYFGVNKGEEKQLRAHAWVCCDELDVVGGESKSQFNVINYFTWAPPKVIKDN